MACFHRTPEASETKIVHEASNHASSQATTSPEFTSQLKLDERPFDNIIQGNDQVLQAPAYTAVAASPENPNDPEAAIQKYRLSCSCFEQYLELMDGAETIRSFGEAIRYHKGRVDELESQKYEKKLAALTLIHEANSFQRSDYRHPIQSLRPHGFRTRLLVVVIGLAIFGMLNWLDNHDFRDHYILPAKSAHKPFTPCLPLKDIPARLQSFQDCSINTLVEDTNLDFLSTARPFCTSEYVSRRDRLAQALVSDGIDAFIVEPGYTLQYYANINQPDWEVWEPEERPFVMIVQPYKTSEGEILANTSFLVPSFEAERARLLGMPFYEEPDMVTYEEHWNPYTTLVDSAVFASFRERRPKIMVDEEMRDFISRGLANNGFEVVGLSGEVERVRQTKSKAEIGVLRAVNTGTVEAVRAMRKCMKLGLTEDDVMQVLDNTMRAAGLKPFFDIVLFDEDASNPHGGTSGQKRLEKETMVLIDVGAHLYGYSSDICRSFFGPWLAQPKSATHYDTLSKEMKEKLNVWNIVFEAQTASLSALHENSTAAAVDIAARRVIDKAGYGEAFTHRVGHSIGIKAHESPYLHKGNVNTTLRAGSLI